MSQASPKHRGGAGTTAVAKVLAVGAEALLPARPIPSVSREPNLAKITFFFTPIFFSRVSFGLNPSLSHGQGGGSKGRERSVVWDGGTEGTWHPTSPFQNADFGLSS